MFIFSVRKTILAQSIPKSVSKRLKLFVLIIGMVASGVVVYEVLPEQPKGIYLRDYDGIKGVVIQTSGLVAQCWYDNELFATRDVYVFRSLDKGLTWEKVAKLGLPNDTFIKKIKYRLGRLKLVRKFKNNNVGIDQLKVLKDRTALLSYGGYFYHGVLEEGKIVCLENTYISSGSVLHQGCTEDGNGIVYIGQYITDNQYRKHDTVNLYWSLDQGKAWSVRNEFKRSVMRHIHSVSYDVYRNLVWVATGDEDNESHLLFSDNQCASFQILGSGDQLWKAVSMQFTPESVYWGSDIPGKLNYLFRWNWNTMEKHALLTVKNPFYYSVQDGNGNIFFSTAVEDPENDGYSTKYSELWKISKDDGRPPVRLLSWQKGSLNMWGRIHFAQGKSPQGWIAYTPINLAYHHCETIVMNVGNE